MFCGESFGDKMSGVCTDDDDDDDDDGDDDDDDDDDDDALKLTQYFL
jgi:hypothetical protein